MRYLIIGVIVYCVGWIASGAFESGANAIKSHGQQQREYIRKMT